MKPLRNATAVLLGLLIPFQAGIAQQMAQDVDVVIMPTGETLLRWFAHQDRTYFIQASDPNDHLSTWIWSSLIESGNDQEISHEVGSTADKGFFRLHYTDALPPSGVTLEDWDADGDSLSNALELFLQGNPLNSDTSNDGIPDGWAYAHGLSLSANSASGLFQGGPATNFQAYQQGVQAIPGATLQDHDGDLLDNDLDAVPDDWEINWQKTPEKRYVWIEQVTRGGAKAVSKHGHILFAKSNVGSPGAPNPVNVLWDSNTSSWVGLTGASSWSNSGFVSGNTPDVFNPAWSDIDDMNDEGVVIGRSKLIGPDDPIAWVLANAIMKWQMSGTATHLYAPPLYIVPGFDYVAPYGDLKETLVEGTPRIADDGTISAVAIFLEAGNILPADAQWVASAAQVATHSKEMAQWKLFDMATYWQDQFHSGAVIGAAGGLLVEHQSSIPKTILYYRNGGVAESLESLLPSTEYAITDTDIGRTPATSESPEGRIWFSVNHAGGDAAFLEKRAGGSGVSRWHKPPSMAEGAFRLNAHGEAITHGTTSIPPKLWRNGNYTDLNDVNLTSKPTSVEITKAIDIASNGIILVQAVENGLTKTGLLVPVEVSWKAIGGFDNVDDHIDPWNKPIYGKRIFPDFKNPDDTEIRHKLELIVKTSPALFGRTVYVKSFDVDDSTAEDFDRDDSGTTPVIDTIGIAGAGDDNVTDFLNTPQNGQFWTGSAWGGQTAQGTVDANGETKFIFRVGMQPGSNYRVVASVIDEAMYEGVQTSDPATAKYLGPETGQNGDTAASPLLTVWRRLWVENDSMEAIPEDIFNNKRNDLNSDRESPIIRDVQTLPNSNFAEYEIDYVNDSTTFLMLENERFKVGGIFYDVIATRSISAGVDQVPQSFVTLANEEPSISVNMGYRLYDDDDFGLNKNPLPRTDLVADNIIKDVFKVAFIEIIDANAYGDTYNPNKEIAFYRNHPLFDITAFVPHAGIWDDGRDMQGSQSIWVANIVVGYQGDVLADGDPYSESPPDEGLTPGRSATFHGDAKYSVIYVEQIRDILDSNLRNNPSQAIIDTLNNEIDLRIKLTAAHEIGHHPRFLESDEHHNETGLMQDGGYSSFGGNTNDSRFSATSIKRFRNTWSWQQE